MAENDEERDETARKLHQVYREILSWPLPEEKGEQEDEDSSAEKETE